MLRIPFQNENLCAYLEKDDGTQTVSAGQAEDVFLAYIEF
jgi:hypothetical protein